jgi:hypothetical protein
MRRLLPLLALLATPAFAADNALIITPGAGVIMRTIDDGATHQIGTSVPVGVNGVSAWGTAGAANANVLTVQGIALMTPLLVTLSGANTVTANQGGAPWTVNPGTPANWALAATAGAVPANAVYNGMNVGGTLTGLTGTGTSLNVNCTAGCAGSGGTSSSFGSAFPGTGTAIGASDGINMQGLRVSNYGTAPGAVNALAVNAFVTNTNANGQDSNTSFTGSSPVVLALNQTVADPCTFRKKSTANFSSSTSGGSIITASASNKTYLCAITVVASAAASVSIIEGTGSSVCTGGTTAGVWGNTGVTAANGFPLAANGGVAIGSGNASVASSGFVNQNICMLFTAGTVVATVSYVQAP